MTFRPSPLFHAAAIVIAWAVCLAIALDRVELLFVALPLLVRLMWSTRNLLVDVQAFDLTVEEGPRTEGEQLAIAITAVIEPRTGPVEILPILPALLAPSPRATVHLPQPGGAVGCELAPACQAAGMLDFGRYGSDYGTDLAFGWQKSVRSAVSQFRSTHGLQ